MVYPDTKASQIFAIATMEYLSEKTIGVGWTVKSLTNPPTILGASNLENPNPTQPTVQWNMGCPSKMSLCEKWVVEIFHHDELGESSNFVGLQEFHPFLVAHFLWGIWSPNTQHPIAVCSGKTWVFLGFVTKAGAAGYQAVWGVAHALHTPLMSVTWFLAFGKFPQRRVSDVARALHTPWRTQQPTKKGEVPQMVVNSKGIPPQNARNNSGLGIIVSFAQVTTNKKQGEDSAGYSFSHNHG